MCAGAIYWANIGRVVYGMTERRLLELTGSNEQNPTFDLPCREVFSRGQKRQLRWWDLFGREQMQPKFMKAIGTSRRTLYGYVF